MGSRKVESHPEGASGDFREVAFHSRGTDTGDVGSFFRGVEHPGETTARSSAVNGRILFIARAMEPLFRAECDHGIKSGSLAGRPKAEQNPRGEGRRKG